MSRAHANKQWWPIVMMVDDPADLDTGFTTMSPDTAGSDVQIEVINYVQGLLPERNNTGSDTKMNNAATVPLIWQIIIGLVIFGLITFCGYLLFACIRRFRDLICSIFSRLMQLFRLPERAEGVPLDGVSEMDHEDNDDPVYETMDGYDRPGAGNVIGDIQRVPDYLTVLPDENINPLFQSHEYINMDNISNQASDLTSQICDNANIVYTDQIDPVYRNTTVIPIVIQSNKTSDTDTITPAYQNILNGANNADSTVIQIESVNSNQSDLTYQNIDVLPNSTASDLVSNTSYASAIELEISDENSENVNLTGAMRTHQLSRTFENIPMNTNLEPGSEYVNGVLSLNSNGPSVQGDIPIYRRSRRGHPYDQPHPVLVEPNAEFSFRYSTSADLLAVRQFLM